MSFWPGSMKRRHHHLHRLALSALAIALLASCGSSSKPKATTTPNTEPSIETSTTPTTAAPQATSVNPCDLVSREDAQTAIGTALNPKILAGPEGEQSCTYSGPPSGPTAQVEVFAGPGAKKYMDIDQTLGHVITPVDGIGDEAYSEEFNIFFRKGTNWVAIRLTSLDDPATFAPKLEDLARSVVAKL